MAKKDGIVEKTNVSKKHNQAFYWFRRNSIQSDDELYTRGRMLLQMALLQPYIVGPQKQADGFDVTIHTSRRIRRLAVEPFTYKGIEAPLFAKKGGGYGKYEVEGQSWNDRFNACPHIKSIYFRLVTLRIDLASVRTDGTAYASTKGLAEMIGAKVNLVRDALHDNRNKDAEIFEIRNHGGGIYSFRPRIELVAIQEKPEEPIKSDKPVKSDKLNKQKARFIIETEFDIHRRRAVEFVNNIVVPAHTLQLKGKHEQLVEALGELYNVLREMRRKAGSPLSGFGPFEIIKQYIEWLKPQCQHASMLPTTEVLAIKSGWFKQFKKQQDNEQQEDIITGKLLVMEQ